MTFSIPMEVSKYVSLFIIVAILIFLIKAGTKIVNIIIMVICLGFCWYSFFTEEGAARLSITLVGHPIVAYTTSLERQDSMSTNEVTYFKSSKDVIVKGKKQEYVKCYTKWIVRIPSVEENF